MLRGQLPRQLIKQVAVLVPPSGIFIEFLLIFRKWGLAFPRFLKITVIFNQVFKFLYQFYYKLLLLHLRFTRKADYLGYSRH